VDWDFMNKLFFSKKWYLSAYPDVASSGLNPYAHFNEYGSKEKRFKSVFSFLAQENEYSQHFLINGIITLVFNLLSKLKNKQLKLILLDYIVIFQRIKFRNYTSNTFIVSSWITDGVAEAINTYVKLQSRNCYIYVLKGVKNFKNEYSSPVILEIWKDNQIVFKTGILFPIEFIRSITINRDQISKIHIHHTFNIEKNISSLFDLKNTNKYYYIHDYYAFTSNWHLFDEDTNQKSLVNFKKDFPNTHVNLEEVIGKTDLFICSSQDVYNKCRTEIPSSKLVWFYPPELANLENLTTRKVLEKNRYKILVVGNMSKYKGIDLLEDVVRFCELQNLPFDFVHFGRDGISNGFKNYINYTGYSRNEMLQFCRSLDLDFAFLPFRVEETYSFTLSDIFLLNLPLVTIGRGAITERCFGRANTIVLPPKSDFHVVVHNLFKIALNNESEKRKKISKIRLEKRSRNPDHYYFL
jgi:glycosyltransferase involved in cell wall biosynthesis